MEQSQNTPRPEAATDEPASSPPPSGPASASAEGEAHHPEFATEAEEIAYWKGMAVGIRAGGPPPGSESSAGEEAPFESRRVRSARHDGFTGPRRALFLEEIAEGATVAGAARAAGISPTTAYNLRNRREGRAFDLAWEAAIRRGRKVLADRYRDRAIEGQVSTRYDKDGNVVGTRHFVDNRLAMAVLTRLDRKCEAYRDDERLVTALAQEFEELLDCIEEGGDAEAFIDARRPPSVEYQGEAHESDASIIARHKRMHRFDDIDPEDIDTADLDPAKRDEWTDDQWDRAEASGFLDALPDEEDGTGEGEAGKAGGEEDDGDL